ncbi:MAG: hypothetical protein LUE96_12130 [Lachnospiraceae bacterium]|nr:hypothetical protein [Lachnospiraceae bacterium]
MAFYECFFLCCCFFVIFPALACLAFRLIAGAAKRTRGKYKGRKHISKAAGEIPRGTPLTVGDVLLLGVVGDLTVVSILTPERRMLACGHWYDDAVQDFIDDECLEFIYYGSERIDIIRSMACPGVPA